MSHFSTELRVLLEERQLSQNQLHRKTRIGQGSLSRYLNAVILPDWKMVERIARAFPDVKDRTRLIVAHGRSVIHPALAPQLRADEVKQKQRRTKQDSQASARDRMPAKLRRAYESLGAAAIENPHVADLVVKLASFLPRK
jgi:transcriptional regulator with XRE-family HTH domain